jgi:hypothetical protein
VAPRATPGSGARVAGALIVIVEATVPMPEIALDADAHGRFTLQLPDGSFRLRAESRGLKGEAEVTVPPATHVRLALLRRMC